MGVLIVNDQRIEHPDAGRPCFILNHETGEKLKAVYGCPMPDGRHLVEVLDVDQDWLDEWESQGVHDITNILAHVNDDCLVFADQRQIEAGQ